MFNVSPHTHFETHLTGSTVANLIGKAKELGRTHIAYTDHGSLTSCLKAYGMAKKTGLKFIAGIEVYFKDPKCPIVAGTWADRCRYFTLSLYCEDQAAYQELCQIVSKTNFPTISMYEENFQLWSWEDLQRISKFNVNVVLGGVHDLVGKVMLSGKPDLAEQVLVKLNDLFKDRLAVSLICEPWSKKYSHLVEIKGMDGSRHVCQFNDLVTTNRARRIKAIDLIERAGHTEVEGIYNGSVFSNVSFKIDKVISHKGFLPLPGGDAMLGVNNFLLSMAEKYNLAVLASDYAYYANKEDKIVQTMRLEGYNKLYPTFNMKSEADIARYLNQTMKMPPEAVKRVIEGNNEWAKRFDKFELKYEWRLADVGENPLKQAMEIIRKNGRMKWDDPMYVERLKEELNVIAKNPIRDLVPYFLPIVEVICHYKENGYLNGPGRGSAAGSLFSYLLGITEVNPFKHNLSFNRFFNLDRILNNKNPDVDSDLESRSILVGEDGKSGFLYGKWGDKAAQISTRTTMRLKNSIKDVNRFINGRVEDNIENFVRGLPPTPQGISDRDFIFGFENEEEDGAHVPGIIENSKELQNYIKTKPKEWDIVSKAVGITRSFSKHASAFLLSDQRISDIIPVRDGTITQYEHKEVEQAGLLKYDFLVVNQLKDIRVCLDLINKKNQEKKPTGHFTHKGKDLYIWDLPEEADVFKSIWDGSTETLFQVNTKSMIPFVKDILPQSIEDLSVVLSIVRPGPLDFIDESTGRNMAQEYVYRRNGNSYSDIQILDQLIPETYSVLVYQEQITKIAKEVGGFSGLEAEILRENIGKKKASELAKQRPKFIEGAKTKISEKEAVELWDRIETFGRYSFNKSHGISYSYITYASMFLRYHYPLEWWAAILTNATEQEISGILWPYIKDKVMPPDINLSDDTMTPDYDSKKIRSKFGVIRGLGEASMEPIIKNRPYKDIQDFVNKEVAGPSLARRLIHIGVLDSLFPKGLNLVQKIKMYQDAIEIKDFFDKKEIAQAAGKPFKLLQPKQGEVPEEYLNMTPLQDAAVKKSILPSLPIDLHSLGKSYSKALIVSESLPTVKSPSGHKTPLIDGKVLERLDKIPGESVEKDKYVACTCFVIEAKEFSYSKDTRRALKLIVDAGNYVTEKVLWPDYNTGMLNYPKELKKGSIITAFLRKRAGKPGETGLIGVVVET